MDGDARGIGGAADLAAELGTLGLNADLCGALSQAAATRAVQYAQGETIYHEGAGVDALYVVRSGRVKLLNYLADGRARIVRLHRRGALLGLNGLLGQDREHTAIAIDKVQVYQVPIAPLVALKERDPAAYSSLIEQWYRDLGYADTWITEFSTGAIRGRVARLIRFLSGWEADADACELALLTGEEMAEVLGVTPESVSRVVADFKRRRILHPVEGGGGERYRCDPTALAREADG